MGILEASDFEGLAKLRSVYGLGLAYEAEIDPADHEIAAAAFRTLGLEVRPTMRADRVLAVA